MGSFGRPACSGPAKTRLLETESIGVRLVTGVPSAGGAGRAGKSLSGSLAISASAFRAQSCAVLPLPAAVRETAQHCG